MRSTILCSLAAAGALAAAGCDTTAPAYSFVGGTIDQSTFPSPVEAITILSDRGVVDTARVDAKTGTFQLELVWGSTYVFMLSPDGQGTPLIARTGAQGQLEVEVTVKSGGASSDIGAVRYWGGSASASTAKTPPACTAGVLAGTTQPCSTGAAALACEGRIESTNGGSQVDTSVPGDPGGSGEVDGDADSAPDPGLIAKSGARYHHGGDHGDDGDGSGDGNGDGDGQGDGGGLQAAPDQPMAVPTLTLPTELGCDHHHHHDDGH